MTSGKEQPSGPLPVRAASALRSWAVVAFGRLRSDDGVTSIEYALVATLISIAILAALTLVGVKVTGLFNTVANKL